MQGQRSLADYSSWGLKESDMTEKLSAHTHTHNKYAKWQTRIHLSGRWSPSDIDLFIKYLFGIYHV